MNDIVDKSGGDSLLCLWRAGLSPRDRVRSFNICEFLEVVELLPPGFLGGAGVCGWREGYKDCFAKPVAKVTFENGWLYR